MSDQVLVGVCQSSLQSSRKFTQRGLDELSSRDDTLDLRGRGKGGGEGGRGGRRREGGKEGIGKERNMQFMIKYATVHEQKI